MKLLTWRSFQNLNNFFAGRENRMVRVGPAVGRVRRLRHLHEVERAVRALRQEASQQEQGDEGSKH